ncbi:uncharacterized protein LOC124357223 [Homalodisca vitripennis]|uniref:uncharacterized protein LOC124357223 n=1 Tax=Homalodisca vitripennis TaxID=197043 RepID=UPI001EEB72DD|nr:uncharacterized protein LOC124357223 [Homalodisca vitripennis]
MVLGTERYSEDPARVAVSSPEEDLSEQDVTAEHANAKGQQKQDISRMPFLTELSESCCSVAAKTRRLAYLTLLVLYFTILLTHYLVLQIFAAVLIGELTLSHGFWYYSSSSANAEKKLPAPPGFTVRSEPYNSWPMAPAQYQSDSNPHMTVALPVAVPYQPQMGPMPPTMQGTLHNVQLVPCLCPVSSEPMPTQQSSAGVSYSQMQQQPPPSGSGNP